MTEAELEDLKGVGEKTAEKLRDAGYDDLMSIATMSAGKLGEIADMGEKKSQDRYIDDHFQLDISTQYAVNENLTFFTDFINVNEEPLRAYWDKTGSLSQYEEYGMKVKGGIKWSL